MRLLKAVALPIAARNPRRMSPRLGRCRRWCRRGTRDKRREGLLQRRGDAPRSVGSRSGRRADHRYNHRVSPRWVVRGREGKSRPVGGVVVAAIALGRDGDTIGVVVEGGHGGEETAGGEPREQVVKCERGGKGNRPTRPRGEEGR